MIRWNSAEGKALFDEWLLDPNGPAELAEDAEPEHIADLTRTAGAFLRRRNAATHNFSDRAVRQVRGTRGLSGVVLGHNVSEDTYTFTRFHESPKVSQLEYDARTERDIQDPDFVVVRDISDAELHEAIDHRTYDFAVRQDTLFRDALVPEQTNFTTFCIDVEQSPQVHEGMDLLVSDYMVLRWLMHYDPLRSQRAA